MPDNRPLQPNQGESPAELIREFETQLIRNYEEAFSERFPGRTVGEALAQLNSRTAKPPKSEG